MSWESGTATSYTDLLDKLNTFLLKGKTLPITWSGTGNGTLSGLIGSSTSVQETITVTVPESGPASIVNVASISVFTPANARLDRRMAIRPRCPSPG